MKNWRLPFNIGLNTTVVILFGAFGVVGWLASAEAALPITSLYNTGVDDNGVALGDSAVDPHYTVVSGPSGAVPASTVIDDDFPIPPWLDNNAGSRWISPGDADANAAPGTYAYETTFDLSGVDLNNVSIVGGWSADDSGAGILLNGTPIFVAPTAGFGGLAWFGVNSASAAAAGAPFVEGANTLTFQATNGGEAANPTGLRVDRVYARGAPAGTLPIPGLYNTGVDDSGVVLSDGADPHYAMTVSPEGTPGPATAITSPPSPPWIQQTASSRWIGPNVVGGNGEPGVYTFETTFDLTGLDASSAVITGLWSVDNAGADILLNGNPTGNVQVGSFIELTPFSISAAEGDVFLPGLNTLSFSVENAVPGSHHSRTRSGYASRGLSPMRFLNRVHGRCCCLVDSWRFAVGA